MVDPAAHPLGISAAFLETAWAGVLTASSIRRAPRTD